MKTSTSLPASRPESQPPLSGNTTRLESATLFGRRDEILITHGDETYRLRRTRQGKLILTK